MPARLYPFLILEKQRHFSAGLPRKEYDVDGEIRCVALCIFVEGGGWGLRRRMRVQQVRGCDVGRQKWRRNFTWRSVLHIRIPELSTSITFLTRLRALLTTFRLLNQVILRLINFAPRLTNSNWEFLQASGNQALIMGGTAIVSVYTL